MKRFAILTIVLLLFSMFNACEEEEKNLLLGKWAFVSLSWIEYENGGQVDSGSSTQSDILYLEFFKGGVGCVYFSEVEYDTFIWEKDGKTLITNEGTEDEQEITIITLTKSTLVFEMTVYENIFQYMVQTMTMSKVEE